MSDDRTIPTPAPADRPTFKIVVDGTPITGEFQIQSVVTSRVYNQVASADIWILDGDPATADFKVSNAPDFVPGNEVEILAGYHGDEETIFKGVVHSQDLRVYKDKPSVCRVACRDAAMALTVGRRSAYYYDMTDSEIIEEVAGAAGLGTEVDSTSVSHAQMVQFYSTDWDFVVTRAEANGLLVFTKDGTLVVHAPDTGKDEALALTYGRNILTFEGRIDARTQFASMTSFAWDAANQEMLEIDGADAGAASPGNLTTDDLAAVVGLDPLPLKHGGQLADDELQAWVDGQRLRSALAKVRGRVRIQGFAALAPGDVIELSGVGNRFSGKALVSGVRHELNSENWETDVAFGLPDDTLGTRRRDVIEAPANGLLPGVSGLQLGLVTALEDPDGEGRVQVRIPLIDPAEEGTWARVSTLDAGDTRGSFFLPEIGDEVVLGFLNDDPRNPIIVGMLNSSAKPPPLTASDDNHEKGFITRSEMKLVFNDDKSTITVETPNGNQILVSDDDGGITLTDENDNKVVMSADGITLESAADLMLNASGDIKLSGSNVTTEASAELKSEGSAGAEISSGGSMVIKGSVVQIN